MSNELATTGPKELSEIKLNGLNPRQSVFVVCLIRNKADLGKAYAAFCKVSGEKKPKSKSVCEAMGLQLWQSNEIIGVEYRKALEELHLTRTGSYFLETLEAMKEMATKPVREVLIPDPEDPDAEPRRAMIPISAKDQVDAAKQVFEAIKGVNIHVDNSKHNTMVFDGKNTSKFMKEILANPEEDVVVIDAEVEKVTDADVAPEHSHQDQQAPEVLEPEPSHPQFDAILERFQRRSGQKGSSQ